MNTEIKVAWGDKVQLRTGSIAQVVEFDYQPPYTPYTIKVAVKDKYTGELFTKWIRQEDVAAVLPKI